MRLRSISLTVVLAALLCGSGIPNLPTENLALAQDKPASKGDKPASNGEKPASKADKPAPKAEKLDPKAAAEKWKGLMARRQKIEEALETLQNEFTAAKPDARQKIQQKAQALFGEMATDVGPGLLELAPIILENDPGNVEAADIMARVAFSRMDYAGVIKLFERLDKDKKSSPQLVTVAGVSYFAMHDFAKAQEVLLRAQKVTDPAMFAQLGAPFLAAAPAYIEFWNEEQAIRAEEAKADDLPQVLFKTTRGDITLELFENQAPNTVANFISLVESKSYDGIAFHRVIPNFMAQGGDPNTLDNDPSNDGQGGPGYTIACECYRKDARKHFQGSLSMAHAGKNTGGSQFFLTHLPTPHLNADPVRQSGHTVFGRVIKGQDVALALQVGDKITTATVIRKRDHEYKPVKNLKGTGPKE